LPALVVERVRGFKLRSFAAHRGALPLACRRRSMRGQSSGPRRDRRRSARRWSRICSRRG